MRCMSTVTSTGCSQPVEPLGQANVAVLDGLDGECREPVSQPDDGWYAEQDHRHPEDTAS